MDDFISCYVQFINQNGDVEAHTSYVKCPPHKGDYLRLTISKDKRSFSFITYELVVRTVRHIINDDNEFKDHRVFIIAEMEEWKPLSVSRETS